MVSGCKRKFEDIMRCINLSCYLFTEITSRICIPTSHDPSIAAWKEAIALCVPSDGVKLTHAEQRQKKSYEGGLKSAKEQYYSQARVAMTQTLQVDVQNSPWQRAHNMLQGDTEILQQASVDIPVHIASWNLTRW